MRGVGRGAGGARAGCDLAIGAPSRAALARCGARVTLRLVLAFHHVAIQCADLARCERFYREVLGLRVLRRWPREECGDRSVWLSVGEGGEGFLALERADAPPEPRPWRDGKPGLHLFALRISPSERRGWEDRLEGAGVLVVHRTRWSIFFHDPEGNRIGLTHHPHDSSDSGAT
jgi:catechol 2,3-dioxygenase-like lactoylglutathione lyase family enzyme